MLNSNFYIQIIWNPSPIIVPEVWNGGSGGVWFSWSSWMTELLHPFRPLGPPEVCHCHQVNQKMSSNRRTICFNMKCNSQAGTVYLVYRLRYRLDEAKES